MNKIAIVILNWNGKKHLENFLPSVIQHSTQDDVVIYVVDNGSSDDSVLFLKSKYPSIQLICFDKNHGFAGGYNKAVKLINAKYYIVLNSDVEVTPNWINPIVDLMESDQKVAAAMPKIKAYHDKDSFEYAGAGGGFIDKFGYPFCRGRILNQIEKDEGQYNDIKEVFWATGACMFVRASAFKELEGFDDDFFAHMEEIDLCWRFKNAGYKIMYNGNVEIYHVGGGTLPNNNPRKLYLNYRNNWFMLFKNLKRNKLIPILLVRYILDWASAFIYLLSFQFSFAARVFKAHFAFWLNLKMLRKKRKKIKKQFVADKHDEIFPKSIVFNFFVLKKKIFRELKF